MLITRDIMAPDAAIRMRDATLAGLGRIDILVNCAGGSRPLPLDASEESWEEGITLNFIRQHQIIHALLPQMPHHQHDRQWEPDCLNATFSSETRPSYPGTARRIGFPSSGSASPT